MPKLKALVVKFPGTNCDEETKGALLKAGFDTKTVNHDETLEKSDLVVLPGGFSFGDYVSCGRIAKFSYAVEQLKTLKKTFILGICNGFQILLEAGFLPGALLENIEGKFISDDVEIEFSNKAFSLPIANHQGRYYINDIKKLTEFELIKYKNNPNGSYYDIAGLYDTKKHILGLMPHPERNYITPFKPQNGKFIFDFVRKTIEKDFYGIV